MHCMCVHEINRVHKQDCGRSFSALVCVLCSPSVCGSVCVCALLCAVEGRATGLNKSLVERIFMKREVNATWEREGGERESRRENVTVMY